MQRASRKTPNRGHGGCRKQYVECGVNKWNWSRQYVVRVVCAQVNIVSWWVYQCPSYTDWQRGWFRMWAMSDPAGRAPHQELPYLVPAWPATIWGCSPPAGQGWRGEWHLPLCDAMQCFKSKCVLLTFCFKLVNKVTQDIYDSIFYYLVICW